MLDSASIGMIAAMVAASAVVAAVTTLFVGALSDKLGRRKAIIVYGYLLWGLSVMVFALVRVDWMAHLVGPASAAYVTAVLVVVLDCVMTFFGSSANDAAVAVAELVGGSEEAFVARMNARAAELGMENTAFKNACGLDTEGHLSTARDVAVMSRAILRECPEVLHYSGIWTDTLRGGETMLVNTNKLLRRYEGITGLKTGTTGGAGVCISASASRDGLDLIAVVLGSDSSAERFDSATRLLDYGFANYEAAPLPDLSGRPLYLDVTGSDGFDVPLDYSALPERLLVPRGGASALTASVELPGAVPAPLSRGDEVGTVTIAANGTPVGSWPICAAAGAAPLDFDAAVRLMLESLL